MAIVLTRVDGRLIHGQVALAWTRNVGAEKIIVIDDDIVNDKMQRMLLELAAPSGVTVEIYDIAKGSQVIKDVEANKKKTMLIFKKPDTVLELIEKGISIVSVNIGGMYYEEGKKQVDKALFVDERDIQIFKKIQENRIELFYQVAPMTKKQDLFSILD